jgi:hypothetical protein
MALCLLYRHAPSRAPRFYRVEIAMNLFGEVSVLREWGIARGPARAVIDLYGNLRDASLAADLHRNRALKRGYARA